jgi:hypothetical protein
MGYRCLQIDKYDDQLNTSTKLYRQSLSPNSYDATQKHTACRFIAKILAILS